MRYEQCHICGAPAAEYDPRTDAVYCTCCAVELADRRWLSKSDAGKLDDMGFESIASYGRLANE